MVVATIAEAERMISNMESYFDSVLGDRTGGVTTSLYVVCCTLIDLDRLVRTCREAKAAGRVNASEVDEGERRGQDTGWRAVAATTMADSYEKQQVRAALYVSFCFDIIQPTPEQRRIGLLEPYGGLNYR